MVTVANLNSRLSMESASFLSGIEKSRGALRSLITSLDPVAAATAKYNRQVEILETGLKRGRISVEEHGLALQRLNARYNEQIRGQGAVTSSTGSMRAGMQQLGFQIGDVATQFASGTRPMMIFAQQSSQVIQSIQLMTRSTRGFLGFIAGPWGQIITAGAIVLSTLTAKMFENAEAAKAAELASDGLSDAQSALGAMFDLTSGKLERQNDLLRLNAQLTAVNLRAEAAASRSRAQSFAQGAEIGTLDTIIAHLNRRSSSLPYARESGNRVRSAVDGVLAGRLDASRISNNQQLMGDLGVLGIDRAEFLGALRDAVQARSMEETAAGIDRTLASNRLDPAFRRSGRGGGRSRRPPADRTDQREERFNDQLSRLRDEQLSLTLAMTSDLRYRANIERERVEAEVSAYETDLRHQVTQREITQERADQLIALRRQNADLEFGRINRDLDNRLAQEEVDLRQSALGLQQASREGELDAARTMQERRRIQLQMLDAETEQLRFAVQQQLLSRDLTEADRERLQNRLRQIDAEHGNRRAAINRDTMGPLAQYLDSLPQSALEMNEALERVAADGLQSLEDGLADVITGTKSVGAAFKDMANQIISDLARIAVRRLIVQPLANALFGGGGGGGGFGSIFGGFKADGGPVVAGMGYVVGERGAEWFEPDQSGTIIPNHALGGAGGGTRIFDLRGAMVTTELVNRLSTMTDAKIIRSAPVIIDAAKQQVMEQMGRGI